MSFEIKRGKGERKGEEKKEKRGKHGKQRGTKRICNISVSNLISRAVSRSLLPIPRVSKISADKDLLRGNFSEKFLYPEIFVRNKDLYITTYNRHPWNKEKEV